MESKEEKANNKKAKINEIAKQEKEKEENRRNDARAKRSRILVQDPPLPGKRPTLLRG